MAIGLGMLLTGAKMITGIGGGKGIDIDKGIGHIASGLDKLNFSPQERAGHNLKVLNLALDFMKENKDQNSIRSVARRTIAVLWIRFYLLMILGSLVAFYFDKIKLAEMMKEYVVLMGTGTLVILGFFFGVHLLRGFVGNIKKEK